MTANARVARDRPRVPKSHCRPVVFWIPSSFCSDSHLDFEEFPWGCRQNFGAARRYQSIVFYSNSADAFDVNTGLQGYDVARLQTLLLVPGDPWIFVDLQP